jgi:FolB domain-containing protein
MPDKIYIRDLELSCIIGTNPHERQVKQTVCINIALDCDLEPPGRSDCLDDTLDYKLLKDRISENISASRYFLIEKLAHQVAELCLAERRVQGVRVTVDKPGALTGARSVAAEIYRQS